MSYLENKSKKYAKQNMNRFDNVIKDFQRRQSPKLTKKDCDALHNEYKVECDITHVIQLSYLFKNGNEQYNAIQTRIINSLTKEDFSDIYRDYIGNIHKRLFGRTYEKMKLIPKFENSDRAVDNLLKCVLKRIEYHFSCREYTIRYDVPAHENELLRSVYMFRKVKEVQSLLNMFIEKYKVIREHINSMAITEKQRRDQEQTRLYQEEQRIKQEKERIAQEVEQIDRELSDFENLSLESSEPMSEPFIQINNTQRK